MRMNVVVAVTHVVVTPSVLTVWVATGVNVYQGINSGDATVWVSL